MVESLPDYDYAVELQPDDEYRQVAESHPHIADFDDEIFISAQLITSFSRLEEDNDYEHDDGIHSPGTLPSSDCGQQTETDIDEAYFFRKMTILKHQRQWVQRASRRSSHGFQKQYFESDKSTVDRFLVSLASGISVVRHQSCQRSESVWLASVDGCRTITWASATNQSKVLRLSSKSFADSNLKCVGGGQSW